MKVVALIPARIGSTRFPAKMLAKIVGKSLIVRTYESTRDTGLFSSVLVVTDSDEIEQEVKQAGGDVYRSTKEHATGTDRIAEAAEVIDADVIINIQGDEPFLEKDSLQSLVNLFNDETVQAGSLVLKTTDTDVVSNPNRVKVLLNDKNDAIYFSRSVVPHFRNADISPSYYIHVGIYAFRKNVLIEFAALKPKILELAEQLECNRFIEYNIPIRLAVTNHISVAVDTVDDLQKAEEYIKQNKLQ